jgi:hypothetical protein
MLRDLRRMRILKLFDAFTRLLTPQWISVAA